MTVTSRADLPTYDQLILPTIRALATLGGSARGREITAQVLADIGATEEQVGLTYGTRSKSVLVDRADWARSYATLGGALDRPERGLFVMTPLGREILAMAPTEALARVAELDREVRGRPKPAKVKNAAPSTEEDEAVEAAEAIEQVEEGHAADSGWQETLLRRLHRMTPEGFEDFVVYLLKTFGMELTRIGGTGDEGIDAIGLAPISPVLSSRVAVQAKRYDPSSSHGREVVALFQRDAAAAGAERAVLVTLGRFSPAARKAAIVATPTVNLIDGERLCELVAQQGIGVRSVPIVLEEWFDRFD
ncbi:MAG: Mrr restriction system protein [Aeromicrobium sp.]|nr:Mrr restriction system protein [Aeromicrobium sp.]